MPRKPSSNFTYKTSERVVHLRERLLRRLGTQSLTSQFDRGNQAALAAVLGAYVEHIDRGIARRPRSVIIWDRFWDSFDLERHGADVAALVRLFEVGDDLSSYLSNKAVQKRPKPKRSRKPPRGINWTEKDMALNGYGFHHLHLRPMKRSGKRSGASDDLLFVRLRRDDVALIHVGNHKSFHDGSLAKAAAEMKADLEDVLIGESGGASWQPSDAVNALVRGYNVGVDVDGKCVIPHTVSLAGTSFVHTRYADECADRIEALETAMMEMGRLNDVFAGWGIGLTGNEQWEWEFDHADLVLIDRTTGTGYRLAQYFR